MMVDDDMLYRDPFGVEPDTVVVNDSVTREAVAVLRLMSAAAPTAITWSSQV
jgi:hypothetical protein